MSCLRILLLTLALLTGGAALAQESRGWIGTSLQDVSKAEADRLGWDGPRGAKLGSVAAGSPADKAGLKAGDIVVAIERTVIDSGSELDAAIAARRPGEEVRLQVLSGGRERRVALTVAAQPTTQIADKAQLPVLMLDTGGHMAVIKGLAFTPDGRQIVSAGDDKVVRVWDWRTGRTVRAIRGESGAGSAGKIYALALSPDGRWLATAGWSGSWTGKKRPVDEDAAKVRIWDFASGELVALLKGHESTLQALAYSPDGKLLASAGYDNTGIVWDVSNPLAGRLLHRLRGHEDHVYAVAFMPDGRRIVTGSYDKTLRLWDVATGRQLAVLNGHKNKVRSLAVSPRGSSIVSGDLGGDILLWDGTSGRLVKNFARQANEVGALAFSRDGKLLLSSAGIGRGGYVQHIWDVASGREVARNDKHDNTSFAATWSPDGRYVVTGGFSGDVQVWHPRTGSTEAVLRGTGAQRWTACFSPDSRTIYWGQSDRHEGQNKRGPLELSLRLPAPGLPLGRPERLSPGAPSLVRCAQETFGNWKLTHTTSSDFRYYDGILMAYKDGAKVAEIRRFSYDGYRHRSYSFTVDGQAILSGGDGGHLIRYDLDGKATGEFIGHESEVWALSPSPDRRLLVTASADQTVRLWNVRTGELLVTLFHGRDGEWVMWTPQGYYTASPGADSIIGWQINKGPEQSADYVGAEQLRQHLNRPDIVERAIILASAEQAVREAPGTSFKLADLLARPVPRFRIVSPVPGSNERAGRTSVRIAIEATPDPIRLIRIQVNGRQVGEETPGIGSGGFGSGERALYVPLARGRNEIRVALTNAIGEKAETLVVNHDGEGDLDQRGALHILAIGVNDYKGLPNACGKDGNASCDLSFPRNDATRFADAIEKRLGPAHAQVIKRVLVNGGAAKDAPTAANITDAVEVLRHARETDTVVLFIAGHGSNEGPDYRFLPTNVEWVGGMLRGSTVVPWQVLQGAVEAAKGRRMLFVDTCHSGGAYNQRLGNSAYHANIVAYTAARFDQEAIEDAKLGHGLFTYAVVEGLEGKGDVGARRQFSTKDLAEYIRARVGALAKAANGEQEPQYFKGRDADDFVLARW